MRLGKLSNLYKYLFFFALRYIFYEIWIIWVILIRAIVVVFRLQSFEFPVYIDLALLIVPTAAQSKIPFELINYGKSKLVHY